MYVNCSYDSLKREKKISYHLMNEQHHYCCYCMRKLYLENLTIEHVMPHKVETKEVSHYYHYNNLFNSKIKRLLVGKNNCRKRLKVPPYPHFCAYENLVASCDGSIYQTDNPDEESKWKLHKCCNNIRGKAKIIPIFYLKHATSIIKYEKDGELTYNEILYDKTIKILKLEEPTLAFIRRSWAKLAQEHSLQEVLRAKDDEILREILVDDLNFSVNEQKRLLNRLYWYLLCEYSWFYAYFKQNSK